MKDFFKALRSGWYAARYRFKHMRRVQANRAKLRREVDDRTEACT